jgi:hypothetical protein
LSVPCSVSVCSSLAEGLVNASHLLKERILAEIASVPSLTRVQGHRLSRCVLVAGVLVSLFLFELAGGVSRTSERSLLATIRLADGWALASAAITWMVARQRARPARPPHLLFAATVVYPVVLFAWTGCFEGVGAQGSNGPWACFAASVAFATPPLVSFLAVCRGSEPDYPEVLGAGAGAASAAWGGVLGLLWCPDTSGWHSLVGHVAPVAVLTVAGSVAGRAVLGLQPIPRRRRRRRAEEGGETPMGPPDAVRGRGRGLQSPMAPARAPVFASYTSSDDVRITYTRVVDTENPSG